MTWPVWLIIGLGIAAAIGLACWKPIRQDLKYHQFADTRPWGRMPNGCNVWSNAPFVLVGVAGLVWLMGHSLPQRWMWVIFYLGVALTGFGSGYYHIRPCNATLVWDRLPMTIAFMPFFAALISERINEQTGVWLCVPLLVLGVGSVFYWQRTDDLRPYAWVQFYPMLAIPLLAWLCPAKYLPARDIFIVIGWYGLAKVTESLDAPLLRWTLVSGHSWKHIAAAAAPAWLLWTLAR